MNRAALTHLVDTVAGAVTVVAGTAVATLAQSGVETFWPTSAVGYLNLFLSLATAIGVLWGFQRFLQRPTVTRLGDMEARLKTCEQAQAQMHEMTQTLREMRDAQTAFRHLAERLDNTVGRFGRELSHLQGAFEAWDGRTERRHTDRRHHQEGT